MKTDLGPTCKSIAGWPRYSRVLGCIILAERREPPGSRRERTQDKPGGSRRERTQDKPGGLRRSAIMATNRAARAAPLG